MNRLLLLTVTATALIAESAPLIAAAAPSPLEVLFINDFSLNFLDDSSTRSRKPAKLVKCINSAFPEAAAQFEFTSAIVDAVDASIDLRLQYDFYQGGKGNSLDDNHYTREDFENAAGQTFRDFCFEGPLESDLPTYVHNELHNTRDVDVLVLFTAAQATELTAALPIDANEFKVVIVVGLNGADASSFYPTSSISITDFSQPEQIASMISATYAAIQQLKNV